MFIPLLKVATSAVAIASLSLAPLCSAQEKGVSNGRSLDVVGVSGRAVEGEDWRKMTCEHPAIANTIQPAKTRWESIGADTAWKELVEAWEKGESRLDFMRFVAEFFNMDEDNNCHLIQNLANCKTYMCSGFENKERTGPAASIVVNALAQVGMFMGNNLYAVHEAKSFVYPDMFASTFSEGKTNGTLAISILTNLLSAGFTSGLAPMFNSMMKHVPTTAKYNAKDVSYAAIALGALTARDFIGPLSSDENGNHASAITEAFYDQAALRMAETSKLMFNGDPESIEFLYSLISEGKMTQGCEKDAKVCGDGGVLSATEMRHTWQTAMYGYLIPQMWKLADVNPVVIITDAKCDDVGVGTGRNGYIRADDAEWARGCLDNKLMYLLSPPKSQNGNGMWSPPPGLESIKNDNWRGVKVEDIIVSAAKWTLHNGNRKEGINDPAYASKTNYDLMWDVIEKGESVVRTPGLVDIPACTEKEARSNWSSKKNQRWYSWPCNE